MDGSEHLAVGVPDHLRHKRVFAFAERFAEPGVLSERDVAGEGAFGGAETPHRFAVFLEEEGLVVLRLPREIGDFSEPEGDDFLLADIGMFAEEFAFVVGVAGDAFG